MKKNLLVDRLKENFRILRLKDMAQNLETILENAQSEKQGHLEFLAQLVDTQVNGYKNRSLERRLKQANFPRNMSFDNFDWNFQPGLNIEHLKNLKTLNFVSKHQSVLILGKTGCGKTHIASALGLAACEAGFRVKFYMLQELLAYLYSTLADETTVEAIEKLARLDLIIIDRIGFIRTKNEYASLLLEMICACQDRVSIITTSNISIEEWGQAFGSVSITNDIVDRLFYRASILNIKKGISYRLHGPEAPQLELMEES
ncbi:MAG: ATP-binding protein [Candidatus Magnetomorum sp.]|nr:ATP-binding protein [Candidatus Magnetomorum sp.]